jgi:hypothetical protein
MIIVSLYKRNDNPGTGEATFNSTETLRCPLCGGEVKYRDRKKRGLKDNLGKKTQCLLRRMLCKMCNVLHTEIPDIIQPFKHYDSCTIQNVLDGSSEALQCDADASTMRRWTEEFCDASADISQRLASEQARQSNETIPIKKAEDILSEIKRTVMRWLPFVMMLLINAGHKICTQFAFCPKASPDRVGVETKTNAKGDRKNVKAIENSS